MRVDILETLKDYLVDSGEDGGYFRFNIRGLTFNVIASWGGGWDHVSVSTQMRCPSWDEMCWFKGVFFYPEECVIQYHPPHSAYVNNHPYCLHLWRPQEVEIPRPPEWMVGVRDGSVK